VVKPKHFAMLAVAQCIIIALIYIGWRNYEPPVPEATASVIVRPIERVIIPIPMSPTPDPRANEPNACFSNWQRCTGVTDAETEALWRAGWCLANVPNHKPCPPAPFLRR